MVSPGAIFDATANFIRLTVAGYGLRLYGSSSGSVGLKPAAAAGSVDYTLPAADGTSGQALTTNGTATLSWADAGGTLTGRQQYNLMW